MTSLPSLSQLQHPHHGLQHRQNGHLFSPQQQSHLFHGQLYGAESLLELDGTPPGMRDHLAQATGLDTTHSGNNSDGRRRESDGKPEWGLTKAGKRRQRLPLACQACRKKKVPLQLAWK